VERVVGENTASAPLLGEDAGDDAPLFHHSAAIVGAESEFLDVALPFLDAGLRDGDLVALTCSPETAALVSAELGPAGEQVEVDAGLSLLGARAPDAIRHARRYLDRAAGAGSGRLRVLAEIDFGDRPPGWREGQRFEALCNLFMRSAPISAVCVYDRRRLPPEVLASAAATHPELLVGGVRSANPSFQDPLGYVRSLPTPWEPVEDTPPALAVDDVPSLVALRHHICRALDALVPDADQREDLHLGAAEVASNAFRHGVRPVSARIWADDSHVVCAVSDSGHGFADPLAGFEPAHGDDLSLGGMGLWLARKLWDHVDLLPGPGGLTVRLSSRLR
jgi:anti-sigma regulatory factor (Ser/Thr protein kinase)